MKTSLVIPDEKMTGATKAVPRLFDIMWSRVYSTFLSSRSNTKHAIPTLGYLYREIIGKGYDTAKTAIGIAMKSLLNLRLAEVMNSNARTLHLEQHCQTLNDAVLTAVQ